MKYNRHFIVSAESTKKNFDPTEAEAISRAKLSVDFANDRKIDSIGEIYAKSVFSSDGLIFHTKQQSALQESEPSGIVSVPALDKFIREQIKNIPVEGVLDGIGSSHAVYETLVGNPSLRDGESVIFDKKTFDEYGITLDSIVDVIDSLVRLGHRMKVDSLVKGGYKKWSISKGHSLFDEDFSQVGVSWLDSDSMASAIAGSLNSRLWIVELEVASA